MLYDRSGFLNAQGLTSALRSKTIENIVVFYVSFDSFQDGSGRVDCLILVKNEETFLLHYNQHSLDEISASMCRTFFHNCLA